jgi:hypothetical protein
MIKKRNTLILIGSIAIAFILSLYAFFLRFDENVGTKCSHCGHFEQAEPFTNVQGRRVQVRIIPEICSSCGENLGKGVAGDIISPLKQ